MCAYSTEYLSKRTTTTMCWCWVGACICLQGPKAESWDDTPRARTPHHQCLGNQGIIKHALWTLNIHPSSKYRGGEVASAAMASIIPSSHHPISFPPSSSFTRSMPGRHSSPGSPRGIGGCFHSDVPIRIERQGPQGKKRFRERGG